MTLTSIGSKTAAIDYSATPIGSDVDTMTELISDVSDSSHGSLTEELGLTAPLVCPPNEATKKSLDK